MTRFQVTTTVEYTYDVEADSEYEAEQYGWKYEDYHYTAEVQDIAVYEYPEEEQDGEVD